MPRPDNRDRGGAGLPLLPLPEQELHVWLGRRGNWADSDHFRRSVLSRYAAVSPDEWQFSTGPHGKPEIAGASGLALNVSDSGDQLVCAVSAGSAVGVDIEYCEPDRRFNTLARRFYHPREARAVKAGDSTTRRELFYDLWTLKEAGVKCEGGALGPALGTKAFALDYQAGAPGWIESFTPSSARHPLYCLLDIPGQYRLAICWRHPPGTVPGLRLFDWRGDDGITPVPLSLRATSALLATGTNLA